MIAKSRLLLAALLLALMAGIAPAAELNNSSSGQWSETDASNTSPSPDGWISGVMTPNQVEPTARSMMGAIKRFWDRVNCTVTATGSANAYVYTPTNASFPTALIKGETYCFLANFTNTGASTLAINGLAATNIFKPGPTGPTALTGGEIQNTQATKVVYDGTQLQLLSTPASLLPRAYLAGLTLANDGGTPNSVLDISDGVATDSTNSVSIALGAFTKSTAGTWVAGSGNNGMGSGGGGLTIANSTWYHVCAAIVSAAADVFFDTDATCVAHKPAGTTASRRIGSFLTDSSAHIQSFTQNGDLFLYRFATLVGDINDLAVGTGSRTTVALTVPPGIAVRAVISASLVNAGVETYVGFSSLSEPDRVISLPNGNADLATSAAAAVNNTTAGRFEILTDTSRQIGYRGAASSGSIVLKGAVRGYWDNRGK